MSITETRQLIGERIHVPVGAEFSVDHERGDDEEEIEFQLKWSIAADDDGHDDEPVV